MYDTYKVYGPYLNKRNNRLSVYLHKGKKRISRNYAKYKMECHLGRYLKEDEIVHHIDGDTLNDDLSNLEIMERGEHQRHHQIKPPEKFNCPTCKKEFALSGQKLSTWKTHKKSGNSKTGPYCSLECSYLDRQKSAQKSICPNCKKEFILKGDKLANWKYNKKKNPNRKGPFCSLDCYHSKRFDKRG